ncbi:MAG: type II secretion system F family protein [Dissulfurispiraceae bacterium]|jgi:type II secretory pathway component PulF|nr:type II secretion system F family protein [Dissulfurispiraceae bacterium]
MDYFSYKAVDAEGKIVSGVVRGDDFAEAEAAVAAKNFHLLDITKTPQIIASVRRFFTAYSVKRRDIIEIANNLSVMVRAGVPLLSALGDIALTTENEHLKLALDDVRIQTEMGMRFSDAVAMHGEIFPEVFVRLIKVGEETGQLEQSLSDVSLHLQKMEDLAAAIKRSLIYPAFAIVTTMGALIFWLAYVLPKIMTLIKEMGVPLPFITKVMMHISSFTQTFWFLIPLAPVIFFIVVKLMQKKDETRYIVHKAKIQMPIVKHVVYNKLLALFSEQMRILIVAGLTIDRALEIVSEVIGNDVFKNAINIAKEKISTGSRIADSLREHEVFSPLVVRMIEIGETSGSLDEQFNFLSEYYLKKLDDVSDKMGKMIEPIVIGFIGIIFAMIIIGLMLPIYDIVTRFR